METLTTIAAIIAVLGGVYGSWKKLISPKLTTNKLRRFYSLVEEWFDDIDRSNISNLKITILNNKENKIRSFIHDNGMEYYRMNFSKDFRKRFLQYCGIKKELQDSQDIFERYSRCPADGLYLSLFWDLLAAAFYEFKNKHDHTDPETNFANIEMRVKLLKMYTGVKTT